ncbi:MAG TPA: tetratricopeptide repeat protein [bacterium]|nr:tetratricopeptide repeat protein [bacterium]
MGKVILLLLISALTLSFTPFEKESDESVKGRESYSKGEMDKASEQFSKAAERLKDNAEAYYDLGNAKLKAGDNEGALDAYKRSLETGKAGKELKSRIFHNMGNAMTGLKKLSDAEKYYIRSLIEKPEADTAENLEIVRRMIVQQEQQQQQQQENKDQQEQNNKDQQQEQKKDQDPQENKDQKNKDQENKDQQEDQQKAEQDEKKDVEKEAASAEEKKDEDEKKEDRKAVLKQFDQRKNLQISPFMLKKESDSQSGQTW